MYPGLPAVPPVNRVLFDIVFFIDIIFRVTMALPSLANDTSLPLKVLKEVTINDTELRP